MDKSVLTDTFQFVTFPKWKKASMLTKKDKAFGKKRIKQFTAWNSKIKIKKATSPKSKKSRKKRTIRLNLPNSKTFPQLVKELDTLVSTFILKKGKYTCVRCSKRYFPNKNGKYINLTCSHYWDRQYKSTRWDEDNLDPLCWRPCHSQKWEHDKQGAYKDYMMKKLGKKKFELLEIKARSITKYSRVDLRLMIDNFDKLYL